MGRLIPAGTGMARYLKVGIQIDAPEELLEGPEEELAVEPAVPAAEAATPAEGLMAGTSPQGS